LEKRLLTEKLSKFCSQRIQRLTDRRVCSNFVKVGPREIGKIVGCLSDKNKTSPGSPALATTRIAPKICRGQLRTTCSEWSRFHPNRFNSGGVIPNAWTPSTRAV